MGWSARQGLTTATGVVVAVLASLLLGLQDPWWSAISAWVVAAPDRHQLLAKATQRVLATLVGLATGLVLAAASNGQPALLLLALFCVGATGSWARQVAPTPYAWVLGAVTATMVLVQAAVSPSGLFEFAANRTAEIVTGVLCATLVALLIMPAASAPPAAAPVAPSPDELAVVTLSGGLVLVAVLLLWQRFDLPQPMQMAISALVVLDRDLGSLRHRGRQRVLGCVLGGGFGLVAMTLGGASLLLWLGVLGLGLFLFSVLHHGGGPSAYVGTQGGLAVIITLVSGRAPPASILPVAERLAGATLGVVVLTLVAMLVLRMRAGSGRAVAAP
ncbi:FUSC family protein [Roseomonas sp. CAU 1739]|uniref:FUSC family protein n=1 Tax=Roseomonas sp. CAU 1739 TaxID=3140364 RepID=UPI00325AD832